MKKKIEIKHFYTNGVRTMGVNEDGDVLQWDFQRGEWRLCCVDNFPPTRYQRDEEY